MDNPLDFSSQPKGTVMILISKFNGTFSLSRYGVVETAFVEGVAAKQPPDCKVSTLQRPVFVDGFIGVGRAGGAKAAGWGRTGGDIALIESDQK